MNKFLSIFFYSILLVCSDSSFGQSLQSVHYTNEDGLSDNTVFRITQDPVNGHLWLGSDYGLNRFDGLSFKQYSFSKLLRGQSILAILPKSDGSIVLSYYRDGIYFFKDDTLSQLPKTFAKDSIYDIYLRVPLEMLSLENKILVRSIGNLITFDHQGASVLKEFEVSRDICSDNNGGAFVSDNAGIWHYSQHESRLVLPQEGASLIDVTSSEILFSIKNSVFRWSLTDSTQHRLFTLKHKKDVSALKMDKRNRLWCSTHDGGLYLYNKGRLTEQHKLIGDSNTVVNDLFEDAEGNIWVATNSDGFYGIFTEDPISFLSNELPFRTLLSAKDGSIYAGGLGGLYRWNNNELRELTLKLKYNETVYDMYQMTEDDILIGSTFSLSQLSAGKFTSFGIPNGALSIQPLSDDKMLIGSYHGLFSYGHKSEHFQRENRGLTTRINRFFKYRDEVWCLTDTGVFVWQNNLKGYPPKALSSFSGGKINDACLDKTGAICLATSTGFYRKTKDKWQHFTEVEGLPANLCHCLEMDADGAVWIGTNAGIACLRPDGQLRKLNYFRTLAQSKVKDMVFDLNQNLYLACEGALLKLESGKLFAPIPSQPVLLENIKSNKNTFKPTESEIQFAYDEMPLEISFYTNSFKYAHDIEYEYRLVDQGMDWSKTKARTVTYASLSPGEHLFEVRAKHRASDKFSASKVIAFQVIPAFWMTTWFRALVSCLVIVLLASVLIFRLQTQRKKRTQELQIERRINHLKFQALSASMSPHFVQNVLSSIIFYFHERSAKEAGTYMQEFSELIRLNLRHVQDSYIDLDEEIERLKLYINITQKRHSGRFDYSIDTNGLDIEEIMIPNMIIQPFIENAIWHGILPSKGLGKLDISFHEAPGPEHNFKIVIEDNGIGIHQQKKSSDITGNSIGIPTTIERVQLLHKNNHIVLEELHHPITNEVKGTRVSIFLMV